MYSGIDRSLGVNKSTILFSSGFRGATPIAALAADF